MADPIEDSLLLAELLAIGILAYLGYRIFEYLTNKGGTNCGPDGGKACCSPSQVNTDACVGSDGNPCGSWEFWTATTCYAGTPSVLTEQVQAAEQNSSVLGGVGAIFTNPQFGGSFDITAPTPGVPFNYDPTTGTIGGTTSTTVTTPPTASTMPSTVAPPQCYDVLTGNTYTC